MTDPTNLQRAEWADSAINAYCEKTDCDFGDSLDELLCDLMHWAKFANFDFDHALDRARFHFNAQGGA